jgi:hypothetical protein
MHQEFANDIAIIEWYIGDAFEIPVGYDRAYNMFEIIGTPTAWFDGAEIVLGASPPSAYNNYLPIYQERKSTPSDFLIEMEITPEDNGEFGVTTTIESLNGTNTENIAAFVVLTESHIAYPACGLDTLHFVARKCYPDKNGTPLDFSDQASLSFNTVVSLEDNFVEENCEVIVFVQNMDTEEIYQGTSQALFQSTTGIENVICQDINVYPNPANDFVNINSGNPILSVKLCNLTGQVVCEKTVNKNSVKLNTSSIDNGVYILQILIGNEIFTKQIIINSY